MGEKGKSIDSKRAYQVRKQKIKESILLNNKFNKSF
jgi:hypothetical protein